MAAPAKTDHEQIMKLMISIDVRFMQVTEKIDATLIPTHPFINKDVSSKNVYTASINSNSTKMIKGKFSCVILTLNT